MSTARSQSPQGEPTSLAVTLCALRLREPNSSARRLTSLVARRLRRSSSKPDQSASATYANARLDTFNARTPFSLRPVKGSGYVGPRRLVSVRPTTSRPRWATTHSLFVRVRLPGTPFARPGLTRFVTTSRRPLLSLVRSTGLAAYLVPETKDASFRYVQPIPDTSTRTPSEFSPGAHHPRLAAVNATHDFDLGTVIRTSRTGYQGEQAHD